MRFPHFGSIVVVSALICIPTIASAGINKCTDAAGVVTYSDQPCAAQGQKQAEARDGTAFSMLEARENDKMVAETCKRFLTKRGQCYRIDSRLENALRTNCEAPMKRQQLRQMEQRRSERYRRNHDPYEDIAENNAPPQTDCRALENNVFTFLRENFRNAFTPDEVKALEYHLNAVPSTGRPTFATRNKNERR